MKMRTRPDAFSKLIRPAVPGFPTTWFIDPRGFIVYEQRGWTEKLLEEFSWRIEEIRNAQKQ